MSGKATGASLSIPLSLFLSPLLPHYSHFSPITMFQLYVVGTLVVSNMLELRYVPAH